MYIKYAPSKINVIQWTRTKTRVSLDTRKTLFTLFPLKVWTRKQNRRRELQGDCVWPTKDVSLDKLFWARAQHLLWITMLLLAMSCDSHSNLTCFPPGNEAENAFFRYPHNPGSSCDEKWEAAGCLCLSAAAPLLLQKVAEASAVSFSCPHWILPSSLWAQGKLQGWAQPKKSGGKTQNTHTSFRQAC